MSSRGSFALSRRRAWVVAAVVVLLLIGFRIFWRMRMSPVVLSPLPSSSDRSSVQWFQIVHLPDVPNERAKTKAMREQFRAWLKALADDGFHLRPLSEVVALLARGEGLPAKTVVLVFDPGYRYTYEMLMPLLRSSKIPVVWLTDDPGRHSPDRRFITRHDRRKVSTYFPWDVGLRGEDPLAFTLESSVVPLTNNTGFWAVVNGRYGINRTASLSALNRLHVNTAWDAQELLDRLYAELPVENPEFLGVRQIGRFQWGTLVRQGTTPSFDLRASTSQRAGSVCWMGTLGQTDFRISIRVQRLFGQLWLLLRSDPSRNERLRVGFTDSHLIFEKERGGKMARLASHPCPTASGASLQATVELVGTRLSVKYGTNAMTFAQEGVDVDGGPDSLLEMIVYDRVRGGGVAEGVELHYFPNPKTPAAERG